jgi:TetR/AcrR family transcriptional repressor of lmrAB and yxaGH operons
MGATGTRNRMLESAIDLMRGSGLTGAGINEIVRASGMPKGSVYHFFPGGKSQIAAEALEVYAARVEEFIERALASKRDGQGKVRALFDAFAQRVEQGRFLRSCAVGAVSLDLDEEGDDLRQVLSSACSSWTARIATHFDLGSPQRTRAFASLVLTAIEGAYVRARAEQSSRPFREAGSLLAGLAAPG